MDVGEVEEALAAEIVNCAEEDGDEFLMGRCYGLAHALAILSGSSADEELHRVAQVHGLADVWAAFRSPI